MIYNRHTISKISFYYITYITIILCRNYLQIVRSNFVYFGQINESVCLSVCHKVLANYIMKRGRICLNTKFHFYMTYFIVSMYRGRVVISSS